MVVYATYEYWEELKNNKNSFENDLLSKLMNAFNNREN